MNDRRSVRRRRLKPLLSGLAVLLILAGGIALATLVQGRVSGEEFSPTHFQARSFVFYEVPLLGLQVTPISRTSTTDATSKYLKSQNLVAVPATPPERWDVVRLRRGARPMHEADARLLVAQLELSDTSGAYWEQWSRDHPAAAAVLWPRVQELAERELYVFLPELFRLAQRYSDAAPLRSELDHYLRRSYRELADDLAEAGQLEQSRELLREALSDYPEDAALQERYDALPAVDESA